MKPILFALLSTLSAIPSYAYTTGSDPVRSGYSDSLKFILTNIGTIADPRTIEYCIPLNQAESIIYFSFDYNKELSNAFHDLHKKLVDYAVEGNPTILKKYLYLSQFVDGYFADEYFIDITNIASSNPKHFCATLSSCNPNKVKRLMEAKAHHCP